MTTWNTENFKKVFKIGYYHDHLKRYVLPDERGTFFLSIDGTFTTKSSRTPRPLVELVAEMHGVNIEGAEAIIRERIEGKREKKKNCQVPKADESGEDTPKKKRGRPKTSKQVLGLINVFQLCKSAGTPYLINENQAIEIGSGQYKDYISRVAYTELDTALSDNTLREIAGVQRGEALYNGRESKVYTRVAAITETLVYIDLNDGRNTIIEITPGLCRIAENPDVLFYRPPHSKPLCMPELPGDIDKLKEIISPIDDSGYILLRAALCFYTYGRPNERGTFPIINFQGPAGSLKTTKGKICKFIIDPGKPEGRTLTKDIKDLFIYAKNQFVLHIDNVSHIDADHQDVLCSLASQGGYGRKKNYTDDDETVFEECRPIITNGIEYKSREDLQSRKIDIECKVINEGDRLTEREVWEKIERLRPAVLGGILTAISKAMLIIEKGVDVKKHKLPRLADFAIFSLALEQGNGWTKGATITALKDNYTNALSGIAEESPLYDLIKNFLAKQNGTYEGTASDLLKALELDTDEKVIKQKSWPADAAKLGRWITRNISVLMSMNIEVEKNRSKTGDRTIKLTEIGKLPF